MNLPYCWTQCHRCGMFCRTDHNGGLEAHECLTPHEHIIRRLDAIDAKLVLLLENRMPLQKSSSSKARSANIKKEIDAGKPVKQAVAIGYAVQRKAKGKKRKGY